MDVEQSQQNKEEVDSYRREKAREVAERFLLADGSNQHSASVQLVSAREEHSSTAARAPNTLLQTGGEEREERNVEAGKKDRKLHSEETGKTDASTQNKKGNNKINEKPNKHETISNSLN